MSGGSILNDAIIGKSMTMALDGVNKSDIDFRALAQRVQSKGRVILVEVRGTSIRRYYTLDEEGFKRVVKVPRKPHVTLKFAGDFYSKVLRGWYNINGKPIPPDMLLKQAWAIGDIEIEGENYLRDIDYLTLLLTEIVTHLGPIGTMLGLRDPKV